MGTRNLTAVFFEGDYRIAQYGQWGGYPSGQGKTALAFLQGWDRPKFEQKLRAAKWADDAYMNEVQAIVDNEGLRDTWGKRWPELSRDTAAKILQMVQDAPDGIRLKDNLAFAADSLFCEWAYVIDLDKNTFEVFTGFQEQPLSEGERFYGMKAGADDLSAEGYFPVKLVKAYSLDDLPTLEQMVKDCEGSDED